MTTSPSQKHYGSVQERFVATREVQANLLCLACPQGAQKRDYRAVLEVTGINYHLKSEEEQLLITDLFQLFLAGLSHPIQILVRVRPMNLEPYLERFDLSSLQEFQMLPALATSLIHFLRHLATQRTLLARTFYLIVPFSPPSSPPSATRGWPWQHTRKRRRLAELEQARQQVDLQCSEISRQLSNMGIATRRLHHADLVRLEYSSLRPQHAHDHPLHPSLIEGLDQPVLRVSPQRLRRRSHRADTPPRETPPHKGFTEKRPSDQQREAPLFPELANLLAPASIHLSHDCLQIEENYVSTMAVIQLPRFVSAGWMKPLVELDEPMDISFHFQPRQTGAALRQLRRRQLEIESSFLLAQEKKRLVDPEMQVAQGDIQGLMQRLASGEERLLDWSMYVLLHGTSKDLLQERTERIHSVLSTMLLETRPTLFEQDRGFLACQPHARNELHTTVVLPSAAAATAFPFISNTLFMPDGILEGITPSGEPVVLDWWASSQRNANRLLVAPSGAGKSFKTKLDLLRMHLMMTCAGQHSKGPRPFGLTHQQIVIDPEREYVRVAEALGGQWVRLAPGSQHHLNPFDLPRPQAGEFIQGNPFADHVQHLQALLDIMLADRGPHGPGILTSQEKGLLDRAIYETYRQAGITMDPLTHARPVPLLCHLYAVLESEVCGSDASDLCQRLRRYVNGSLSGLFDGPTNVALHTPLVVFDVHDLEQELRPIGFFLISNYVWTSSFGSPIPRQLIVDELLSLYQYSEGARFLETVFQRARKHYLGITGITQHPAILRNSTIPSNCATQILMAQEAASLDLVSDIFHLSAHECQMLKTCGKGDALLLTNDKRIVIHFEASQVEQTLATTDPRELQTITDHASHLLSILPTAPLPALEGIQADHPIGQQPRKEQQR